MLKATGVPKIAPALFVLTAQSFEPFFIARMSGVRKFFPCWHPEHLVTAMNDGNRFLANEVMHVRSGHLTEDWEGIQPVGLPLNDASPSQGEHGEEL